MKRIILAVPLLLATGCYGPSVSLTWTASPSCVTSSCGYVVYRAAATSATCPPASGTAYTALNQSKPVTATSYKDSKPPASVCYTAKTVIGTQTSVASAPSNGGIPIKVK